jgi:hypothetical protein
MRHATFTRATTGTRINRNRMIESIAAGDRRVTWLERDGVLRPYGLHEPARTNLSLRSQEIGTAPWADSGTPTVTANDALAPDGTTTADLIVDDDGATSEGRRQDVTVADDSVTRTASIFVNKRLTAEFCVIQLLYTGGSPAIAYTIQVNPSSGAFQDVGVAFSGVGAVAAFADVEDVGTHYRIMLAGANNGSGNTTARILVLPRVGSALGNFTSTTGQNHFWGLQFEVGREATSYLATTDATVTRNIDQDVRPYSHAPQAQSGYWRFRHRAHPAWASDYRIHQIGSSNDPGLRLIAPTGTDSYRISHARDGTTVSSTIDLNPSWDDDVELFPQLYADGSVQLHGRIAGGSISSGTQSAALAFDRADQPAVWVDETLHVGQVGGTASAIMALDLGAWYRGVLTPAQLLRRLSSQGVS